MKQITSWKEGKQHGALEQWYFSGALRQVGAHAEGKRDGPWVLRGRSGSTSSRATFRRGVPHGPWTAFYSSGLPALALVFDDGVPAAHVPVVRSSPDGSPWPAGSELACNHDRSNQCTSPLEQLDFAALPPVAVPACAYAKRLSPNTWSPMLATIRQGWPPNLDGGGMPGPVSCVRSLELRCAPDLDNAPGAEVFAEISYGIPVGPRRTTCKSTPDNEVWPVRALVALSPPIAGRGWRTLGVAAFPSCGTDICSKLETLLDYVLLPSGEVGLRVAIDSGGGDCAQNVHEEIRTHQDGSWAAISSRTIVHCFGYTEPEEHDVY